MSVNPDVMSDESADYGDYEYQHISTELSLDITGTGSTSPNVGGNVEFEPLGEIGGLDNNEVAELVYLENLVKVEWEDESADQDVGTTAEIRGVVGANLPDSDGILPGDNQVATGTIYDEPTDGVGQITANGLSEDRIFQMIATAGAPPGDDQTNGPGTGAEHQLFHAEKPFRRLTGRGPVLDSNDDMGVNLRFIVSDSVIDCSAVVRTTMYWDVAQTDEAGRAFSVPR